MTQSRQDADMMERDRRANEHEKKFGKPKGEGWNDLTQKYDRKEEHDKLREHLKKSPFETNLGFGGKSHDPIYENSKKNK